MASNSAFFGPKVFKIDSKDFQKRLGWILMPGANSSCKNLSNVLDTYKFPYFILAELSNGFGTISVSDFSKDKSLLKIFML